MSTFFSGTDTSTLKEEGIDRNHFVSLIVNNAGSYTAAITRRIKSVKTINDNFSYPTFEDTTISGDKVQVIEDEELEWYYLNIEFERSGTFYVPFKERLDEIKKLKEEKAKREKVSTISQDIKKAPLKSTVWTPQQSIVSNVGPAGIIKEDDNDNTQLEFDYDYADNKIGEVEEDISFDHLHFNPKTIKSLVLQLITGSIILPNESKIDVRKWVKSMPTIYKKRFGYGEAGKKLFTSWAEMYIEYICWFTEDNDLISKGYPDDILASVCATDIINELKKLPTNEFISIYISLLNNYVL